MRPTLVLIVSCMISASAFTLGCVGEGGEAASPATSQRAPDPLWVEAGATLFGRYCAVCHGIDARGDGPAAAALATRPADLTGIALRRGGTFPRAEIAETIDGRFDSPAHGTREMPIWGAQLREEVAGSELASEIVRGQIDMLVDYLVTIQAAAP